jgi:methionine aminotransferase
MQILSKLPQVGTTIFTTMSALAAEHKAINLSQGFPDFSCSSELVDLVSFYMKKGMNQYAPMTGLPILRERIAEKTERLYKHKPNTETEITVTSGATEALFAAISAVIQKDDEVIIFEPAYDSYVPAIELNGGKVVPISLTNPNYRIDWEIVKQKISPKTKLIIVNSPHNPTGSILTANDLDELEKIVEHTNIFLISDEVYEHIIFDNAIHQSILLRPILAARSFVISSFGKTFHTTGWKVGYCVAPAYMTKEFRKIHQYLTFSTATPLQYAIADYLQNPLPYLELPKFYESKRNKFIELTQKTRFKHIKTEGTYFQLLDYSEITDEKDTDFAIRLTKEFGVAAIPISVFYSTNNLIQTESQVTNQAKVLRFCFAKNDETLEMAAEKLRKI